MKAAMAAKSDIQDEVGEDEREDGAVSTNPVDERTALRHIIGTLVH